MKKKLLERSANNGINHYANDYHPLHLSVAETRLKRKNTPK